MSDVENQLDMNKLSLVIDCARDHVTDIESGLEDGTYDAAENQNFDAKKQAVEHVEKVYHSMMNDTDALHRGMHVTINGRNIPVGMAYGYAHQVVRVYDGGEYEGVKYLAGTTTYKSPRSGEKLPWFKDLSEAIKFLDSQAWTGYIQTCILEADGSGPSWITAGVYYMKNEGHRDAMKD